MSAVIQSPSSLLTGERVQVAEEAISHLADLTAQRDREQLDVTLAQGVLELLNTVSSVGVYRLVGRDDEVRRWLCSGLARRNQLSISDPPWVDLDSLPAFNDFPTRQQAVEGRSLEQTDAQADALLVAQQNEGDRCVTVLPLLVEVGLPGVLEVRSELPLSLETLRPIQTLLRVFGNFQNLLESSQRDTLTGLLNRQTFDATFLKASMPVVDTSMEATVERRAQTKTGYWLGVVDIDHFKRVNDGFGHLIGDEVLVLVARIMRQSFRHYDRLYRFGGEEFVILLRGGTEDDARAAFERFRTNVESYLFPQVKTVTVSVGFTEVQLQDTPSQAFSRADQGVYQAKHQGRNRVLSYETLVREGVIKVEGDHIGDVELF
ncbi:MAG: GGDEF domain-containing protein [Burkholderiales bacterium]|nr:GGDEF domain-containing protein [Burkholderiales bacterium]MDE2077102.1 GGDEF domain-containing protein [Burkholderiales bacterium]MDE2431963.1 GGDEF domain-containing protein [Burkholderiales bacterium]